MAREQFRQDLKTLDEKLLELGHLTEEAISEALDALKTQNVEKALKVIDNDSKVDALEEEINDFAILLIAKQAPVARDLRRVIVAIKISADVERIADFAVNIAKATIRIGEGPVHDLSYERFLKMAKIAQEMLAMALKAFNDEDVIIAKQLADMDDEVDELHRQTIKDLMGLTKENQHLLMQVTQLAFVSRYFERIADHTTNIAEGIFYLVKGKRYELND